MAKVRSKKDIKRRKITFEFESSDAKKVILMGDFNNWNPKKHPMKKDGNGIWTKAVMLFSGKYEYKFLISKVQDINTVREFKCVFGVVFYN